MQMGSVEESGTGSSMKETDEAVKQEQESCLIFLGTFYHDNHNEHNVDLIQFKEPVRLLGIRVIPLGATVNLSNGSSQLGATNPSELELEFYYNDLQDPTRSTFSMMEKFKYQEKQSINFSCESPENEIFTDGILVRGLYSSLTLATYGYQVPRDKIKITSVPEVVPEEKVTEEGTTTVEPDKEVANFDSAAEVGIDEFAKSVESNEAARVIRNDDKQKLDIPVEGMKYEVPRDKMERGESPQAIPTITTRFNTSPPKLQPKFESVILNEEKIERVSSEEEPFDDLPQDTDTDDRKTGVETTKPVPATIVPIEAEDISDEEIICDDEDEGVSESGSRDFSKHNKSAESVSSSVKDDVKSSQGENAADASQGILSDQDGSFGEDLSEFVEQISDAELDDYTDDDDSEMWEDTSFELPSMEYNPLSPAFNIRPLRKMNIESFVAKPAKADKAIRNQVIHNLRKYSEESFKEALLELWVESMEQTLPMLPAALDYIESDAHDCIQILSFWVKLGLDLNLAKTHRAPPFIVRHLKAGLRLAELLSYHGGSSLETLFQNHVSLLESLFEILDDEMLKASLIQRLVCKVLGRILDCRRGWDEFMSSKGEGVMLDKLELFLQKNVEPRCAIVTKNLLTKVTLTCRSVAINELAMGIAAGMKVVEKQWMQLRTGLDDLRLLTFEVFQKHRTTTTLEKHGTRTFSDSSSSVGTFRLLQEFEFMKSLTTILYCPDFEMDTGVLTCIVEIIRQISKSEIGLVYLCAEGESTKRVIKKLFTLARENSHPDTISILVPLCLEIKVMGEIDNLVEAPPWTFDETEEDNNSLQRLHSLLSSDVGRDALIRVFTMGGQIRNLLRIIKDDIDEDELGIICLCRRGYAIPLLSFIVKFSDNSEFIKTYGPELHDTISSLGEDVEGIEKLKELLPFLKVSLESSNFTFGGIDGLSSMLESLVTENFLVGSQVPGTNYGFTPEIIAILRIFNDMAHTDDNSKMRYSDLTNGTSSVKELEWLQNCVEINSKDVVPTCVKLLKKIAAEFDQQGFLSARLVGARGDILISFVLNSVKLVNKILTLVIRSRQFDYHEVESAEALIEMYGILKHYPSSSKSLRKVAACASCIVDTIGLFTIPLPNLKTDEESENQLKKCMWTRTISAVLKFILRSPSNVLPGLDLLLELLPDSSPITSAIPLDANAMQAITINHRRWGVYMHGVTEEIHEVIGTYSITAEINVLKKLRLFSLTLANLSASSCLMICRAIIDKVSQSVESDCEISKTEATPPSDRRAIYGSHESANCLRFLSSLVKWNSKIKTGIMQIVRASSKLDEKYAQFIGLLCSVLTSFQTEPSRIISHLQAQEWVVSIFHSLCDVNNNLFGIRMGGKNEISYSSDSIFANSLPAKESISAITSALISVLHLDQIVSDECKKLVKGLFSTLEVLMQTDYGFHHLKSALLNQSSQVHDYLEKLVNACATAKIEDTVTVQAFAFINFLHSMINTKNLKAFPKSRQNALTSFELRKCFILSGNGEKHLLEQLRQYLENNLSQAIKAEVDPVSLCLAMEQLVGILTCIRKDETEYLVKSEITLPPAEPLDNLFTLGHESEKEGRFGTFDEENVQPDLIAADLVDLSQGVFSVDLTQLNAFYKIKDIGSIPGPRHDNLSDVKAAPLEDLHNFKSPGLTVGRRPTGFHHSHRGNMRGTYNRSSGHSSQGGSHFDRFRSRPPNTSRPPSLHVDDFVAMESSSGPNSGRMGLRSTTSSQDPYSGRGRGARGSNRPYDSDRPFRSNSQANTPYYAREARGVGRGSRGRGWATADTRSSPARGNYGGRQEQSGAMGNYGRNDDNYRSTRSGSAGVSGSSGGGPIRNSHRYTRQYREAPPASSRNSSSSSSSWRDKPRSSYR